MSLIHSTALVDPKAELDSSVSVGPYTVIGPHVRVAAGPTLGAHCVIEGHTTIGTDNRIFQFQAHGRPSQTDNDAAVFLKFYECSCCLL